MALFTMTTLIVLLLNIILLFVSGAHNQCLDDQRSLLLQLQSHQNNNLFFSTKLVNWNQTSSSSDCCTWPGVGCDVAGHVTDLDLSSELLNSSIVDSVSPLFSLRFLRNLNLANNSFNYSQISPHFGNLSNLENLNLSNSGFAGQIPIELSLLRNLTTLDLSALYFPGTRSLVLQNPNLSTLLQNLTMLTELRLDGANISAKGSEWCHPISSSLPNLRVLSLTSCFLSGPIDDSLGHLVRLSELYLGSNNLSVTVPEFFTNFTGLIVLRLSSCSLFGNFPSKIFQLPKMRVLDLGNNLLLQGSLPEFPRNSSIRNLVLSNTNFSGTLPLSIGNLKNLSRLELSNCNFSGVIPDSIANLTELVRLDLKFNKFTGAIPSFSMSKNLAFVDLSHNSLTGSVPSSHFEGLSKLEIIDMGYNSLNGTIPSSLFSLPSLQKVLLSNNRFNAKIADIKNKSLSPLDTLDISRNNLQGSIPQFVFGFRKLNFLSLSFNNFSGNLLLEVVQNLENLTSLDLSYNNLSIDASESDSRILSSPQLSALKLASCNLKSFPALMNQSRMITLDLSNNRIRGKIPNWVWDIGDKSLSYLNLSVNYLEELQKPYSVSSLSVIDLHSNRLSGEIPIPPEWATYVDYSSNFFNSSIPDDIGNSLNSITYLSVSNNSLTGPIPPSICSAANIKVLDLSNNRINGSIPQCLIEKCSETLGVLNLGNNLLSGEIMGEFPNTCALNTLDFNGNLLGGKVPKSLANCNLLEVLNLRSNQIRDEFPCFLKISSSLRVLVLRSNNFRGNIWCKDDTSINWPKLQIIDLAQNNFSGDLPPETFSRWNAMMSSNEGRANHLQFEFFDLNHFYYQDTVTVTNKGLDMELVKILTLYTSIDFSSNRFKGEIPETIGALESLYFLNLSHNALTGQIPTSLRNLTKLESLDLSQNSLSGRIPGQLTELLFLSFLNLTYNDLVGMIPRGNQFNTFEESSFRGNLRLCGYPLNNKNCNGNDPQPLVPPSKHQEKDAFDWQFIFTGMGFGIGAGLIVGPLILWKRGSKWSDNFIAEFVGLMLKVLAIVFKCCRYETIESESGINHITLDETGDSDEDEENMQGKAFTGRYCVYCSKLDIQWRKAIHNPNCSCYEASPFFSFSSSSSCS